MDKKRVIIDVDAGVDDALAIILALRSPELEVVAITTVSGNVNVALATKNVLRVLTLIADDKWPVVAKGAGVPLNNESQSAHSIHGEDGLGDLGEAYYPSLDWDRISPQSAVECMLRFIRAEPSAITIVATGPLTNIATAIRTDPSVMARVKEIIAMSGAIEVPGNIEPLHIAEFNAYADPDALSEVLAFSASVPITLVPLDVTHSVSLMRNVACAKLSGSPKIITKFAYDCSIKYMDSNQRIASMDGAYLHDPLAVGVAINPSLVTRSARRIDVDISKALTRGTTKLHHTSGVSGNEPNCWTTMSVKAQCFLDMFLERIT